MATKFQTARTRSGNVLRAENVAIKPVASKVSNGNQNKRIALSSNIQNKLANDVGKPVSNLNKNIICAKETAKPTATGRVQLRSSSSLPQRHSVITVTKENAVPNETNEPKVVSRIPRLTRFSTITEAPAKETLSYSSNLIPSLVENIDSNDTNNVLLTPEYVNDIYAYLRTLEAKQCVKPNHLQVQKEMTPKMRSILIDWLINVHNQFKLLPETLYLGISVMDRFLQKESVAKDKIQLVGVTAFYIACKYEEIYPPDIKDFVFVCDQLYTKRDIIKMEMLILRTLKFELGRPLPLHFLRRNSKAAHADSKIHTMAKYLMELTLVEYECAHWNPSLLAATALFVTLKIIGDGHTWTPTLAFYSNYSESELIPHAATLCKIILKAETSKFQTCRKKYSVSKLLEISKSPELCSNVVKELAKSAQ